MEIGGENIKVANYVFAKLYCEKQMSKQHVATWLNHKLGHSCKILKPINMVATDKDKMLFQCWLGEGSQNF